MSDTEIAGSIPDSLSGRQIARAAGLVMIGFVLSRVLGLVRETVIAAIFGGGYQIDIYFTAARPPDTIFTMIAGGALASAFIPTYIRYVTQNQREEAWRTTAYVINAITLVLVSLSILGMLFSHQVVTYILAPEFDPAKAARTAELMRIMLITPCIFGVSGLLMGILNAHQQFLVPALAPAMYNIGIILGAFFLSPVMGVDGLAWGTVLGAALHLVVQLPALLRLKPFYTPRIDFNHLGLREVTRLMGPRVLGLAIVQINFWVELFLASGMVHGSISALRWGFILMLLPQGVIAQSIAIAVFPTFSAQVASGDQKALATTLGQVLRSVIFLSLPATVGLVVLRLPLVQVILQRGKFSFEDSQSVAWALLFYGTGLVFHSILEIITRAFYALHDTRTPVLIGGGATILNVVFSLIFMRVIGVPGSLAMGPFGGLALANTVATTFEVIALLVLIRPRVGGLEMPALSATVFRSGLASLVMGLGLWIVLPFLNGDGPVLALKVIGSMLAGGLIYWGLAWGLGSDEARLFTRVILQRFQTRRANHKKTAN